MNPCLGVLALQHLLNGSHGMLGSAGCCPPSSQSGHVVGPLVNQNVNGLRLCEASPRAVQGTDAQRNLVKRCLFLLLPRHFVAGSPRTALTLLEECKLEAPEQLFN